MMTKEEYQKNLVRMYDSLRTKYIGERSCRGVDCNNCPFDGKVCNIGEKNFHAHKSIEIVENWAEQHPVKTNSQKFEEVFGFKPYTNNCINGEVKCDKCECYDYGVCNASRFWDAEYNEKTKE